MTREQVYGALFGVAIGDAVLMAVNLGNDADTTAAVTGGLAGLYYGFNSIPVHWRSGIKRSGDIANLRELMLVSLT